MESIDKNDNIFNRNDRTTILALNLSADIDSSISKLNKGDTVTNDKSSSCQISYLIRCR